MQGIQKIALFIFYFTQFTILKCAKSPFELSIPQQAANVKSVCRREYFCGYAVQSVEYPRRDEYQVQGGGTSAGEISSRDPRTRHTLCRHHTYQNVCRPRTADILRPNMYNTPCSPQSDNKPRNRKPSAYDLLTVHKGFMGIRIKIHVIQDLPSRRDIVLMLAANVLGDIIPLVTVIGVILIAFEAVHFLIVADIVKDVVCELGFKDLLGAPFFHDHSARFTLKEPINAL